MASKLTSSTSGGSLSTFDSETDGTPREESPAQQPAGATPAADVRRGPARSDAAATPASRAATAGRRNGAWRVVWCHERCYKSEPLREAVGGIVTRCGAALTCHKKARAFEMWASRPAHSRYVLFTDGREVKPCLQALSAGARHRPEFVVVLSEERKHAARVARWARGLPAEGIHVQVHIILAVEELGPLLAEFAQAQALRRADHRELVPATALALSTSPPVMCVPVDVRSYQMDYSMAATSPVVTRTGASFAMPPACMMISDATRTTAMPRFVPTLPLGCAGSRRAPEGADMALPAASPSAASHLSQDVTPTVYHVLAPMMQADAMTLEKMLELAAPEVYEE